METYSDYPTAIQRNDEAQKKCYADMGGEGHHEERQQRLREIASEAKMWMRHLDVIHNRIEVKTSTINGRNENKRLQSVEDRAAVQSVY